MDTVLDSPKSEPSTSTETTDTPLAVGLPKRGRRYGTYEFADGTLFRLQSLGVLEVRNKLKEFPESRHMDVLIALAWVDENGDTIVPCSEKGFVEFLDSADDFRDYERLFEAVKGHCRNTVSFEETVKN